MRRQSFAVLALVPALALGLGACGKDGKGATGSATAKAASDADKMRQFAKCMRDNGINMPDPQVDSKGNVSMKIEGPKAGAGGNPDQLDGKMKAAEAKCKHLQPNGGKPKKLNPEELAKMRALAKCMREHGVNMPDPDPNGGGIVTQRKAGGKGEKNEIGDGGGVNPEGSTFKAADKACAKYRPDGAEGPVTNRSGG
jgi:hypothetical protein